MVQVENAEFWQLFENMLQRDGDNLGCSDEQGVRIVLVEDECSLALDHRAETHEAVLQDGNKLQEGFFRYVLVAITLVLTVCMCACSFILEHDAVVEDVANRLRGVVFHCISGTCCLSSLDIFLWKGAGRVKICPT